jgi:hypothetical protein
MGILGIGNTIPTQILDVTGNAYLSRYNLSRVI